MNFLLRRLVQPARLSLQTKLGYFFSVSEIDKEETTELYKAIIATRTIRKIITPPKSVPVNSQESDQLQSANITYPPLRDEVTRIIKGYSAKEKDQAASNQIKEIKEQCLETAKKNILAYFEDGVYVDSKLAIQERFVDQINLNEQQIKGEADADTQNETIAQTEREISTGKKKITFCPTYLVTGNVFKTILYSKKYLLVTGHFGIGKTYSFMLYHLLTDIIYRYLHKYCKQGKKVHPQIKKFPKLIYLSLNLKQMIKQNRKKVINEIIGKQCYELTSVYPNYNFLQYIDGQVDVEQFYESMGYMTKLVVDQINIIASAARKKHRLNQMQLLLRKKNDYEQIQELARKQPQKKKQLKDLDIKINQTIKLSLDNPQTIKKTFDLANEALQIVWTLRNKFGGALYLSSRGIEESQMSYLDLNGQHSHEQIRRKQLNFTQFSETPQNISDLTEFFVMLLVIKYKQLKNLTHLNDHQEQRIARIKQIVCRRFQDRSLMILPYTIRLIIDLLSEQKINKILNYQSKSDLEQKIHKLIQMVNDKSKQQISNLIKNFFNKSEGKDEDPQKVKKQKKILMLKLFYAIKEKIYITGFKTDSNNKSIVIQASQILNLSQKLNSSKINDNITKNIAYYTKENTFYLTTNPYAIIQILQAEETTLLEALFESHEKIYKLIETRVSKGLYIESLIRHCLSEPLTQFQINLQINLNQFCSRFYYLSKGFNKNLMFNSIPFITSKDYDKYHFLASFKEKLTKDASKQGTYLFMPTKQNNATFKTAQLQKKIDETSKKIDFVLVKHQTKNIQISAFDVTIQKEKALSKITDFFYEFSNFEDKEQESQKLELSFPVQKNVELNYIVLIPQINKQKIPFEKLLQDAISQLDEDMNKEQQKMKDLEEELENQDDKKEKINKKRKEDQKAKISVKIQRFKKRKQFLSKLSEKDNLDLTNSLMKIKRSGKLKSLLTQVSVASIFDSKFKNQNQKLISLYKGLLEQAKIQFYQENK